MRASRVLSAPVLALAIAVTASAAPPEGKGGGKGGGDDPDPPAAFEPEFGGIRIGGRNKPDQIVLTNRDNSVEVVTLDSVGMRGLALSIDTAKRITFWIDNSIYLQSWSNDPSFSASEPEVIYTNNDGLGPASFSPDGTKLAFLEKVAGQPALRICNLHSTELACASTQAQPALNGWDLKQVSFHPDDNNKVVFVAKPPTGLSEGVYVYTLGGPAPSETPLIPGLVDFSDVGPSNGSNPPLLVSSRTGETGFYSLTDGNQVFPGFDGFGFAHQFNCSSDAVLYIETSGGGAYIGVQEFGGQTERLLKKGWNVNAGHDWIRKANCQ